MKCDSILSNEKIKHKLLTWFKNGNIPHAIILEGSSSELLDLFVREISKYAVCNNTDDAPCFSCSHCKKAEILIHPDIKIYSPESISKSLPIDVIREIRSDCYIKPNEAKNKIYILKNCDNMSGPSSSALLKILEEPPDNIVFILTCFSCSSLIETIKSRCQLFSLESDGSINNYKKEISKLSEDILNAIIMKNEAEVLIAACGFVKNRDLFFETLKTMEQTFHGALEFSYGFTFGDINSDMFYRLSEKLTKKALIYLIRESQNYQKMLKKNANTNLLSTNISICINKSFNL